MSLNMTLSFCAYEWFLDFVKADYVVTGQIGQFRVDHHEALGPISVLLACCHQPE